MSVRNISSLSDADVAAISQALKAELGRLHFTVVTDPSADIQATVTFSEGSEGCVWVAKLSTRDGERLAMVTATKDAAGASGVVPVITRNIVGQQSRPFLDFFWKDLLGGRVTTYWTLESSALGRHSEPSSDPIRDPKQVERKFTSRDPRGEIFDPADGRAMVSGALCISNPNSGWFCGDSSDGTWPMIYGFGGKYAIARNYFSGLELQGADIPQRPFYSASFFALDQGTSWITTELDGKARLYDKPGTVSASFSGWGDDMATIRTGCRKDWQVLVTGAGDWTRPDHLQIYEIRDRQAVAIGQPLDFPGPILALWESGDMRSANVVSRNLQTGMYEASIVSVTCSE